jgi:branched-chain amino acid transport system permease protein
MSKSIRTGLWSGLFSVAVVALFGGGAVLICGLFCGVICGLLAGARSEGHTPQSGASDGALAAGVAGALLVAANLLRSFVVGPALGLAPAPVSTVLLQGLLAAGISALLAAALGAVAFLPNNRSAIGTWSILGLLILVYPFIDRGVLQPSWLPVIITSLIFILLALGLNVVVGYAGLLDLGYAAFFAIGAYTVALLSSDHLGRQFGYEYRLSFWLVIWLAAGTAAFFGLILGSPTLPLRGDYLAIVTLGFGEIVPIVFRNLDTFSVTVAGQPIVRSFNLTGGEPGISPIDPPNLPLPGVNFADRSDPRPWYFLLLLIILFSIFMIRRLRDSRLGRAWMAMREDELAASSMGINIVRTKLLAFAMGASFSGFGGAYYASFVSGAFPSSFDFSVSVIVLCMVILGGLGNIYGVIIGGLIIELTDRLFLPQISLFLQGLAQNNPSLQPLQTFDPNLYRFGLFGLVLVLMMQLRPEGLLPSARRRAELHAADESASIAAQERADVGAGRWQLEE